MVYYNTYILFDRAKENYIINDHTQVVQYRKTRNQSPMPCIIKILTNSATHVMNLNLLVNPTITKSEAKVQNM
jgi:hypothetical protein